MCNSYINTTLYSILESIYNCVCVQVFLCYIAGGSPVSLSLLLRFVTGLDYPPAIGFIPSPSVSFIHRRDVTYKLSTQDRLLSQANTCANELIIPADERVTRFRGFKDDLEWAILGGTAFASELSIG